jgi:hypothetical protein
MLGSTLTRAVGLSFAALAGLASVAVGACPGDGPEVVLDCFSLAYSARDVTVLESVLAPDYIWVTVAPPQVEVFKRETSVASSVEMFGNQEVESVSLEFREGYRVVQGAEPKTWRIEDLLAELTVKHASATDPSVAPLCVTLYVRETTGENAGYEVYREIFFEGEGCIGK